MANLSLCHIYQKEFTDNSMGNLDITVHASVGVARALISGGVVMYRFPCIVSFHFFPFTFSLSNPSP